MICKCGTEIKVCARCEQLNEDSRSGFIVVPADCMSPLCNDCNAKVNVKRGRYELVATAFADIGYVEALFDGTSYYLRAKGSKPIRLDSGRDATLQALKEFA